MPIFNYNQSLRAIWWERKKTPENQRDDRILECLKHVIERGNLEEIIELTHKDSETREKQQRYRKTGRYAWRRKEYEETPADPEARLERGWFNDAFPQVGGRPSIGNSVQGLATYQFPLFTGKAQRGKGRWGAIDLLGIDDNNCPIVIELKSQGSKEGPALMLMQALSYAISLRANWNHKDTKLFDEWNSQIEWRHKILDINLDTTVPAPTLQGCSIICCAPPAYFKNFNHLAHESPIGQCMCDLVNQLKTIGFPVRFAELVENKGDGGKPSYELKPHSLCPRASD